MPEYKFNIGDLLQLGGGCVISISSPANPNKQYKDSLRVVFRFWDGQENLYVVAAEDGICLILAESEAVLQEPASELEYTRPVDDVMLEKLERLGVLPNEVRSTNVGESDYSMHVIQPWAIWLDYNLNAFDADIVKRVLRHKATDPRRKDYEKIIHICQERIRQIDCGIEI